MTQEVGERAIVRSINSVEDGGFLELGFFGGEPFLASKRIILLTSFAREEAARSGINLAISVTTNGTILDDDVWSIVSQSEMNLSISIDGRPPTHNHNRCFPNGDGSSEIVERHIKALLDRGVTFRVVTVVAPETVAQLDEEIKYLHELGCHHIELSLDVWSPWGPEATEQLRNTIPRCAQLWLEGLPTRTLSWFDDKAAQLTESGQVLIPCGFGKGDIAVTPSGHLYPCERLVQADDLDNPMRLRGNVFDGDDFDYGPCSDLRTAGACQGCAIKDACNTTCGCCNHARTGEIGHPDKLLCLFNQWCLAETELALEKVVVPSKGGQQDER
jgi:uncharacterized protein